MGFLFWFVSFLREISSRDFPYASPQGRPRHSAPAPRSPGTQPAKSGGTPAPWPPVPPYLSFPPRRGRERGAPAAAPGQRRRGARRQRGGCGRPCCGTAAPSAKRLGVGRDGTGARRIPRSRSCSALLPRQRSAPLRLSALRGSEQHAGGRPSRSARTRACPDAGGLLPSSSSSSHLCSSCCRRRRVREGWRSGWSRLWDGVRPAALSTRSRSAGAPSGDAKEEEAGEGARRGGGGETGSAFPAQVEKGRAPHLSRNTG